MTASLIETAAAAAKAGGAVALRSWRNLTAGEVSEKKKNDFVTDADRESEERIVARIREAFPADNFLGEEGGRRGTDAGARTWIIDPIDGTSNFIAGFPFWCVSVAAREKDELVAGVVWDPLREEIYTAERGAGAFRNGAKIRVTGRGGLGGARSLHGRGRRLRRVLRVPPLAMGHRRRGAPDHRGRRPPRGLLRWDPLLGARQHRRGLAGGRGRHPPGHLDTRARRQNLIEDRRLKIEA